MRHTQLVSYIKWFPRSHYIYAVNSIVAAWSDVSALPISCSMFLLDISGIHALIINIIYAYAFT